MTVVTVGSSVLYLALIVGGVVAALALRRRDPRAAVLTACGFGCLLVGGVVGIGWGFAASLIVKNADMDQIQAIFMVIGVVIALIRLAGIALVFLGLLRVVRRDVPAAPGMGHLQ